MPNVSSLNAIVLFDTRYGNTEKVAKALAKGIRESTAAEVTFLNIDGANVQELAGYEFIAIGGPTEYRTASKPMSIFLNRLKQANIKGKYGFAFDTRVDSFWSGSAGRLIENELKTLGFRIVKPHTSAYVIHRERFGEKSSGTSREETREERKARKAREKEERRASAVLVEGMEELFENLGNEIGRILALSS